MYGSPSEGIVEFKFSFFRPTLYKYLIFFVESNVLSNN